MPEKRRGWEGREASCVLWAVGRGVFRGVKTSSVSEAQGLEGGGDEDIGSELKPNFSSMGVMVCVRRVCSWLEWLGRLMGRLCDCCYDVLTSVVWLSNIVGWLESLIVLSRISVRQAESRELLAVESWRVSCD